VLQARGVFRFRTDDGQQVPIVRDVSFELRNRRVRDDHGPVGLRQVDAAAPAGRPRSAVAGEVLVGRRRPRGKGDEEFAPSVRRGARSASSSSSSICCRT
jgi:hypothetical protein